MLRRPQTKPQTFSQGEALDDRYVARGANWAKWLGIVKVSLGVLALWMMASSEFVIPEFTTIGFIVAIIIGGVSISLGLKLLNPETRHSSQFTVLIWIYGISLALHVVNQISLSADNPRPAAITVPILTAVAFWHFLKGRRKLKDTEVGDVSTDKHRNEAESQRQSSQDITLAFLLKYALSVYIVSVAWTELFDTRLIVHDTNEIFRSLAVASGFASGVIGFGVVISALTWSIQNGISSTSTYFKKHLVNSTSGVLIMLFIGGLAGSISDDNTTQINGNEVLYHGSTVQNRSTPGHPHLLRKGQADALNLRALTDGRTSANRAVQTWMETALRSSPELGNANIKEWIPSDTYLIPRGKHGNFYKVYHNGTAGYVHYEQIKPEDRF